MSKPGEPHPRPAGATAANWQEPPYNRWSFWHLRELLPTHRVRRGETVRALPDRTDDHDLLAVPVALRDRSQTTVRDIFERTYTDAYAVAHDGSLVAEGYAPSGAPDARHALLSVTKSLVGCVTGVLADRKVLDLDRDVAAYVPELAGSGFAGATVQQVLDMRSGVRFVEDYTDPEAEVRLLDAWVVGDPGVPATSGGLYRFLTTLRQEVPHGSRFLYRSADTDVLGWVCERASGRPMAELISSLVWAPMGAEHDAEIISDPQGTAMHDGGMAATARDLVRFGQLLLDGGAAPDESGRSRQVLPPQWLRRAWAVDAEARRLFLESPAEGAFPGGWYRNQLWFRPGEHGDVMLGLGIHGQMLHVCRRTRTVSVKLSSWPAAQQPADLQDTLRAFDAIGGALAHRASTGDVHRLPGVVSGLRRSGGDSQRRGGSVI